MLLHFSSQGSDFSVALLHEGVEPLALLSEDGDLVLAFGPQPLARAFAFEEPALELFVLGADQLELVLQLAHLAGREAQVLLGRAYLVVEAAVLGEQLLDPLFVGVVLLVVGSDAALVLVEFGVELAHLAGGEAQVLLRVADLLVEVGVLLEQVGDLLLEQVALLVVGGDPLLVLVQLGNYLVVLVRRKS